MANEILWNMDDKALENFIAAAKKEQQRRKDNQIMTVKEQFTQKINEIIDLAAKMEERGIGVELEFASDFETRAYRLPDEDLDITAHVFHIYKGGE